MCDRVARGVFLDRDGVLNKAIVRDGKPFPPRTADEFELLEGAEQACELLAAAGFLLIVVTNQPDLARGAATVEEVDAINHALSERLPLTSVRICPHDDADDCGCRKPRPGLLLAAASDFNINLAASVMVGDRWRDVEAGQRAGCRTVWIRHDYREREPTAPDRTAASLLEAADWIIANSADRSARREFS
jgi:D-glycero-D-manno-heptose 1,7-bisphosphate phosphatase